MKKYVTERQIFNILYMTEGDGFCLQLVKHWTCKVLECKNNNVQNDIDESDCPLGGSFSVLQYKPN